MTFYGGKKLNKQKNYNNYNALIKYLDRFTYKSPRSVVKYLSLPFLSCNAVTVTMYKQLKAHKPYIIGTRYETVPSLREHEILSADVIHHTARN